MLITTAEYKYLFGDTPKEEIINNDIVQQRGQRAKIQTYDDSSDFYTWKESGITYDEYGTPHVGIIEKTGFEMEN